MDDRRCDGGRFLELLHEAAQTDGGRNGPAIRSAGARSSIAPREKTDSPLPGAVLGARGGLMVVSYRSKFSNE